QCKLRRGAVLGRGTEREWRGVMRERHVSTGWKSGHDDRVGVTRRWGRWIRTIGPRHKEPLFCCGRRIAGPNGGSQKGLFLMRYRWFESISLQQRVCCEP